MRNKHEYIDEEDRKRAVFHKRICDFIEFLFMLSFIGVMMEWFGRLLDSATIGFLVAGAIIVYYYDIRETN